ncbi:hypothetical protein Cgig2_024028 [Carnegiea gigantea]|uniref:Uncharacterized protein n=1 Tax=Carnegiea gigantea TaxID=171969 RepID=A0A9Q1QJT5_9CARY|nr:hypothetical protein Cgig2_024028 [Carnegiea gigantea]
MSKFSPSDRFCSGRFHREQFSIKTSDSDGPRSDLTGQARRTKAAGPIHENAEVVGLGPLAVDRDLVHESAKTMGLGPVATGNEFVKRGSLAQQMEMQSTRRNGRASQASRHLTNYICYNVQSKDLLATNSFEHGSSRLGKWLIDYRGTLSRIDTWRPTFGLLDSDLVPEGGLRLGKLTTLGV